MVSSARATYDGLLCGIWGGRMDDRLLATEKRRQRAQQLLAAIALVAASLFAHASPLPLEGRDINGRRVAANDPSAIFEYDPNLNITWLRNWNVNGLMTWAAAEAWASGLQVGAFGGWMLPFVVDTGSTGCDFSVGGGTDCGYNVQTKSGATVYSETAYLWYEELGNLALCAPGNPVCVLQPGWGLSNTGPFVNMQTSFYWSAPGFGLGAAWAFNPFDGAQIVNGGGTSWAVAVRPGDVIPEPTTLALLGLGLAGLAFSQRKQ